MAFKDKKLGNFKFNFRQFNKMLSKSLFIPKQVNEYQSDMKYIHISDIACIFAAFPRLVNIPPSNATQ